MKYLPHLCLLALCLGGPCDVRAQVHEIGHWAGLYYAAGPCTTDEGESVLLACSVGSDEVHTSGAACLTFSGGESIELPNIRQAETDGEFLYFTSSHATLKDAGGAPVARADKPLLIVVEDVEGEARLILDNETINLRFKPGFGTSIESLPAGRTNLLAGCAADRGTLLALALAYRDEGRDRGFGFVTFQQPEPAIPIEFFDVQTSGLGRNKELELTGAAAVEIRGSIVLVPILVVLNEADGVARVLAPDLGIDAEWENLVLVGGLTSNHR